MNWKKFSARLAAFTLCAATAIAATIPAYAADIDEPAAPETKITDTQEPTLGEVPVPAEEETQPATEKQNYMSGDIDNNTEVSLTDLILLTKWLHKIEIPEDEYHPYNWKAADINKDNVVNVFDLCFLKRQLITTRNNLNPVYTAENLTDTVEAFETSTVPLDEDFLNAQTEFYLDMIKSTAKDGKNTLISPYSIVQALAMTANGAVGQTQDEMLNVIGKGLSMDQLNQYLTTQIAQDHAEESPLISANSIWCRKTHPFTDVPLVVKEDFLKTNKSFYNADIFSADFDNTTVDDINKWVCANTKEMIKHALDYSDITEDTIMALANTVTFDAKWYNTYENEAFHRETWFTANDGTMQTADILSCTEQSYISDDNATGFIKKYENDGYSFVALLPNEGMTTTEYLNTLDAKSFRNMISNPKNIKTETYMPKFEYDYGIHLGDTLQDMGMTTAFNGSADFTNITDPYLGDNIYIGDVIHKTHISVTETGTRAAAVTVVLPFEGGTAFEPEEKEYVILNRPFVYCIVNEDNLPVFIGTVESLD